VYVPGFTLIAIGSIASRPSTAAPSHEKRAGDQRDCAKLLGIPTMDTQSSNALDFHSLAIGSLQTALEAAYEAGRASASQVELDVPEGGSGHWTTMTVDGAVAHLKTWIDNMDGPSQIATLMIHACACRKAAVIDGTHIAAEIM
jgi:hypothetical protein